MDDEMWRARWEEGRIGFHEARPNGFLTTHAPRVFEFAGTGASHVLVPLCGKSTDLVYLASHGHEVTGVEFVRAAATAFFQENGLEPARVTWRGYECLATAKVRIAIGDFFALEVPPGERFTAVYDRAALIAVRPEQRRQYVSTELGALRSGARILLVTLFVENGPGDGPPYSVSEADVRALYSACHVDLLATSDLTATEARFTDRGATRVLEQAYAITVP